MLVFRTKVCVCVSTVLILRHQPSWMWTLNIDFTHRITWKPGVFWNNIYTSVKIFEFIAIYSVVVEHEYIAALNCM